MKRNRRNLGTESFRVESDRRGKFKRSVIYSSQLHCNSFQYYKKVNQNLSYKFLCAPIIKKTRIRRIIINPAIEAQKYILKKVESYSKDILRRRMLAKTSSKNIIMRSREYHEL